MKTHLLGIRFQCIAVIALSFNMVLSAQVARPNAPQPTPAAPAPASAKPTLAAPVAAEPKSTVPARLKEMLQKKTPTPSKQKIIPPSPMLERPTTEGKGGKALRKPLPATPIPARPASPEEPQTEPAKEEPVKLILPSTDLLLKGVAVRQLEKKWGDKATVWHKQAAQIEPAGLSATTGVTVLAAVRDGTRKRRPRSGTCRVVVSGVQGGVRWNANPLETQGGKVLEVEAQIDVFVGDDPLKVALTYENDSGVHMAQPIEVTGTDDEYVRVSLPSPLQGGTQVLSGDKSDPLAGTQPVKFGVMIIPQGRPTSPVTVGIANFEVRVATATGAAPKPATKAPATK